MRVEVHGADVQDRDGAKGLLQHSRSLYPFVERVFAGGGYAGKLVVWAKNKTNLVLEIVRRMPWAEGFVVIERRWVVERPDTERRAADPGCRSFQTGGRPSRRR